jgi:hypothetical protein
MKGLKTKKMIYVKSASGGEILTECPHDQHSLCKVTVRVGSHWCTNRCPWRGPETAEENTALCRKGCDE